MNRKLVFALLLFFTAGLAAAYESGQDAAPAEPEIVLPSVYLEIEDLAVEDIEAVLPDEQEVYLSAVDLPLPLPEEMELPEEAFTAGEVRDPGAAVFGSGLSFYSEGMIGAGSNLDVTGDISLYRTGGQPDMKLRFYHNGMDGFAGKSPGQGFSSRTELIEGELRFKNESADVSAEIIYSEREIGLQGLGLDGNADFASMMLRQPELSVSGGWAAAESLTLAADAEVSYAGLLFKSPEPVSADILRVSPSAGIRIGENALWFDFGMGYDVSASPGKAFLGQSLSAEAGLGGVLGGMEMEGRVSAMWHDFSRFLFPFEVKVSGPLSDSAGFSLAGGYRADIAACSDIWKEFPFSTSLDMPGLPSELPPSEGWFTELSADWNINESLAFRGGLELAVMKNVPFPVQVSSSGLTRITSADSETLALSAALYWRISRGFSLDLSWKGHILEDIDPFRPRHDLLAHMSLSDAGNTKGLDVSAGLPVYDSGQSWYTNQWMPVLDIDGRIRVSDGILLSLEAGDLGALFLDGGRRGWNGFTEPGFAVLFKTKISL